MQREAAITRLGFVTLTASAAALGAVATRRSVDSAWYQVRLRKPRFQPPAQVFGPVWTVLYATIAESGARIWRAPKSRARTRALALWGTQLVLNTAWSVLFFGARRPGAALVDVLALVGATAAYAKVAHGVDRTAAWMVTPYLGWLGFATVLNAAIVRKN